MFVHVLKETKGSCAADALTEPEFSVHLNISRWEPYKEHWMEPLFYRNLDHCLSLQRETQRRPCDLRRCGCRGGQRGPPQRACPAPLGGPLSRRSQGATLREYCDQSISYVISQGLDSSGDP